MPLSSITPSPDVPLEFVDFSRMKREVSQTHFQVRLYLDDKVATAHEDQSGKGLFANCHCFTSVEDIVEANLTAGTFAIIVDLLYVTYAALRIRINACSSSLKLLIALVCDASVLQTTFDLAIIRYRALLDTWSWDYAWISRSSAMLRTPTELSCMPTHHSGEFNTSKKLWHD